MTKNVEKFGESATPPISEEVEIAQKMKEASEEDSSLRPLWRDTKEFEKAKERVREELRKEKE